MIFTRPTPRRVWLPLERLRFDPRLQLRVIVSETGGPGLFDPARVAEMREAREGGAEFDPIPVVEEERKGKGDPILWCFGGFHRGEMWRLEEQHSVPCVVWSGTFADALFYALAENQHPGQRRTPAECRKVFDLLLDNRDMLRRAIDAGRGNGGTVRAVAVACGLPRSVVGDYIAARGLRADRVSGLLIPAGDESPEIVERREQVAELTSQGKTQREIADELGVSVGTVNSVFSPVRPDRAEHGECQNDEPADQVSDDAEPNPIPAAEPTPEPTPAPDSPDDKAERTREYLRSIQGHLRAIVRDHAELMKMEYAEHGRAAGAGRQMGLALDGTLPTLADLQGLYGDWAAHILDHPGEYPVDHATAAATPASSLCSKTVGLSRAVTSCLKTGDDFAAKLKAYLAACALIDCAGDKIEGEEYHGERVKFLPLLGLHAIFEAAGLPGKPKADKDIKHIYDRASGGFVPPLVARRRREKLSRK